MATDNSNYCQSGLVLNHLKRWRSITAVGAMNRYRIFRLAARIYDLRSEGIKIDTLWEKDALTGKKHAKYQLARESK